LVKLAHKHGIKLRQSDVRVGKFALIRHQRYAHAKQFKRANRALKTLRTYLGRVSRDIGRKIAGDSGVMAIFAQPLRLARRVREQRQRQRGLKACSLHAAEVACIGKGKAHRPYEFGVKVSVATPLQRCRGGQFAAHVAALPGNPYDLGQGDPGDHPADRRLAHAGDRRQPRPQRTKRLRVHTSGQKRGVTDHIKRELRRRSAVEPVIGHLKEEHRLEAITWSAKLATPAMPSSPPSATTSGSCSSGSPSFGVPYC
jgi:IS5 family transposase